MPYEIVPHLWLGDANDGGRLSADVALVVNCTKNVPTFSAGGDVLHVRIPVDDRLDEEQQVAMYNRWVDGATFGAMASVIARGRDVLVHCQMGRQRSAATIAAFLMQTRRWSLEQAVDHVRAKKREAFFPAVNFMQALQHFEKQL